MLTINRFHRLTWTRCNRTACNRLSNIVELGNRRWLSPTLDWKTGKRREILGTQRVEWLRWAASNPSFRVCHREDLYVNDRTGQAWWSGIRSLVRNTIENEGGAKVRGSWHLYTKGHSLLCPDGVMLRKDLFLSQFLFNVCQSCLVSGSFRWGSVVNT